MTIVASNVKTGVLTFWTVQLSWILAAPCFTVKLHPVLSLLIGNQAICVHILDIVISVGLFLFFAKRLISASASTVSCS